MMEGYRLITDNNGTFYYKICSCPNICNFGCKSDSSNKPSIICECGCKSFIINFDYFSNSDDYWGDVRATCSNCNKWQQITMVRG